jgi:hypothetical protein
MVPPQLVAALRLVSILALSGPILLGCRRDEVRRYRVPKEAAPALAANPPTPKSTPGGLAWTLPEGWTLAQGDGMRYATLKPSTPGKIDISVIALPGTAGGELANVNRWREQMGLPPAQDDKALNGMRKSIKSAAGEVAVFDFTSPAAPKNRMIVGLLSAADGSTWFLKMTGDEAPVAQARKEFLPWIESLRFE